MRIHMMHSGLVPVFAGGLNDRRQIECLFAIGRGRQFSNLERLDPSAIFRAAILSVSDNLLVRNNNPAGGSGDMWISFHNRTLGMFSPRSFQTIGTKQAKSTRIVRRPGKIREKPPVIFEM